MSPVELLRDLIRLRTVNPPGDEGAAAALVEGYLSEAEVKTEIFVSPEGRSNLVARLEGPRGRPALVLLSHSDVVPVEEENWSRDPFGGELADGFIWGRGALDMKGIAVMHAAALAALARSGHSPAREVILVMAADEEAGGDEGMRWLVDELPDQLGFGDDRSPPEVLGEGGYGISGMLERPFITIALGEKTAVWFDLIAEGDPGHGGFPPRRQAPVNLSKLVTDIAGFGRPRVHPVMSEQFSTLTAAASPVTSAIFRGLASPAGDFVARRVAKRLREAGALGLLLSDSITPTWLSAGHKSNVVPAQARASFDSRLLPDTDVDGFLATVTERARRRNGRVDNVQLKGHGPISEKGPLYEVLAQLSEELLPGAVATASLLPGISDLRFFRARGATAYGWCPLFLTPELLATIHGHDERVAVVEFEQAVSVMSEAVLRTST